MFSQKNKLEKFIVHTWIDYRKFKGASRIAAIFLNVLFCILKLLICGVIMLVLCPHIGVQSLRSKKDKNFLIKALIVILTIICLIFDISIVLLTLCFIDVTLQLLLAFQFPMFVGAIIFGVISYFLVRWSFTLLLTLFCKANEENNITTDSPESVNDNVHYEMLPEDNAEHIAPASYSNTINTLWTQGTEDEWHSALNYYYTKLPQSMRDLDFSLEQINIEDIKRMPINEFYDFLHDKFYVWKYTGMYLPKRQRDLEKYISLSELNKLEEIKNKLFLLNHEDVPSCLQTVTKIRGLGVAGGSGLLSILFPESFGTVDKFLIISLSKICDWSYESEFTQIDPEASISIEQGAFLIKILREKATELNKRFNTDFWTPRKIDMILWAIER